MGCLFCVILFWVAYYGVMTKEPLSWVEGLWIRSCDELQSKSFTVHLHRKLNKKKKVGLSTQHSKVDLIFHSPVPLIEEFYFIFFLFAGEWSGHVCQRQGSLFSLTLITSFTNLQIYYSTVCKGVNAITSSAVSRPVMTTGPMKLKLVNFEIWPVWEYRVKTRFRHYFFFFFLFFFFFFCKDEWAS